MSAVPLNNDKASQQAARMAALGIKEGDIEESFVRSGGHGGQNVNKTSTCVMLVHRPTGIQVKCRSTRQQGMNRLLARDLLFNKIEAVRKNAAAAERAQIEKCDGSGVNAAAARRNASCKPKRIIQQRNRIVGESSINK